MFLLCFLGWCCREKQGSTCKSCHLFLAEGVEEGSAVRVRISPASPTCLNENTLEFMEKASVFLEYLCIPFLQAAQLWEGGCCGCCIFRSMTEVLEQGANKGDAVFSVQCHLGTSLLRKDLPMQINLGMLSPTVLNTDLSTWLPIF